MNLEKDIFECILEEKEYNGKKIQFKQWKINYNISCLCTMRESCSHCEIRGFLENINRKLEKDAEIEANKKPQHMIDGYNIGKKISSEWHLENTMKAVVKGE